MPVLRVECVEVDVQLVLSLLAFEMVSSCVAFGCQNRQSDKRMVAEPFRDEIKSQDSGHRIETEDGSDQLDGPSRLRPISFHRFVLRSRPLSSALDFSDVLGFSTVSNYLKCL